jgi:hypothetical protein
MNVTGGSLSHGKIVSPKFNFGQWQDLGAFSSSDNGVLRSGDFIRALCALTWTTSGDVV